MRLITLDNGGGSEPGRQPERVADLPLSLPADGHTIPVRIGPDGALWVVDTGTPSFGAENLPDAPKIVRIDLHQNSVTRIYSLGPEAALPKSHVDDIRFNGNLAYLSDGGVPGIMVLDLNTGKTRRVLDHDRSTTATRPIVVHGEIVRGPDDKPLLINTDQMDISRRTASLSIR
jgi:hypothetical protein